VTVASLWFSLSALPSLATRGRVADLGWKVVAQTREMKNFVRTQTVAGA
jgi:hypothetical protein